MRENALIVYLLVFDLRERRAGWRENNWRRQIEKLKNPCPGLSSGNHKCDVKRKEH